MLWLLLVIIFIFNFPCHRLGRLAHCSGFFLSLPWIYEAPSSGQCAELKLKLRNGTHHTKTPNNTQLSPMVTPGFESYFLFPPASFPTLPISVNWSSSSRNWNRLCYFYIWNNVKQSGRLCLFIEIRKKTLKPLIQYEEWDCFLYLFFHHVSNYWAFFYQS